MLSIVNVISLAGFRRSIFDVDFFEYLKRSLASPATGPAAGVYLELPLVHQYSMVGGLA